MRKIFFRKISYHNFMSFADQSWDFSSDGIAFLISGRNNDLKADDSGIYASNGSGKTNLIQGLMFALYGQFPYKIHNVNIINKYSKELDDNGYIMSVILDFDAIDDNGETKSYKILRGVMKGSQGTIRLILCSKGADGKWSDISKSSSQLTQMAIDDILHMGMSIFQRVAMLSFDPVYNFFKMNAPQKRDFIQVLFDTGIYNDMWELIKKDQSRFLMSLQGSKVKLNTLQGQLSNCEDEIRQFKKTAEEKEKEVANQIAGLEAKLTENKSKQLELEKAVSELDEQIRGVSEKASKYTEARDKIQYEMQLKAQEGRNLTSRIDSGKRAISKHNDILNIVCGDCRTKIKDKYGLDSYERDIAEAKEKLAELSKDDGKLQDALNKVNAVIRVNNDEKFKLDSRKQKLQNDFVTLKMDESGMTSNISQLSMRRTELKDSISDPHKIPMVSTWKSLKRSIMDCEKEVSVGEDDVKYLNICEKVVCPDSIRENIVARVVQSINDLINQYLKELNIDIRCELDDHLDKYTILAPQGWNVDYPNLSKGEQMKLLLATQLAFRRFLLLRFNLSCNCFILDEIVDQNFDTLSISRILDVLFNMASGEDVHVYIISHRSEVSTLVDDLIESKPDLVGKVHRVLVEKTDNISIVICD